MFRGGRRDKALSVASVVHEIHDGVIAPVGTRYDRPSRPKINAEPHCSNPVTPPVTGEAPETLRSVLCSRHHRRQRRMALKIEHRREARMDITERMDLE